MEEQIKKLKSQFEQDPLIFMLFAVVLILLLAFGVYSQVKLRDDMAKQKLAFETEIEGLNQETSKLNEDLKIVVEENQSLSAVLSEEQTKSYELEREQRRNEREIDELTKLTTLDPELLNKYSKVYFLSENYVPEKLVDIDKEYLRDPASAIQISKDVWPYLEDLLKDAQRDDVVIQIASGYRSFEMQKNLKNAYSVQYGAGTANTFSAEQGYSEHQLGTTVDFTVPALGGAVPGFDTTPAFKWLVENAYKHGFILSYPKGNAFYKYEPWHWRFVGQDLARYLDRQEKYFYELDQRDIDEYLIDIFD